RVPPNRKRTSEARRRTIQAWPSHRGTRLRYQRSITKAITLSTDQPVRQSRGTGSARFFCALCRLRRAHIGNSATFLFSLFRQTLRYQAVRLLANGVCLGIVK